MLSALAFFALSFFILSAALIALPVAGLPRFLTCVIPVNSGVVLSAACFMLSYSVMLR